MRCLTLQKATKYSSIEFSTLQNITEFSYEPNSLPISVLPELFKNLSNVETLRLPRISDAFGQYETLEPFTKLRNR